MLQWINEYFGKVKGVFHYITAVELGVDKGTFSKVIIEELGAEFLYLIDLWGTPRYGQDKFEHVMKLQEEWNAETDCTVRIKRMDSLAAADSFVDGTLDFVYIDTVHDYEHTLAELRAWAPKLAEHGILAGHDYVIGNREGRKRYGVIEAVATFCHESDWKPPR
jgi:hypothetical protein